MDEQMVLSSSVDRPYSLLMPISRFKPILTRAAKRKGGEAKLMSLLSQPSSKSKIATIPDDRWLAEMTRGVFQAGFNWKAVDAMWPGFEAAFEGFEPRRWRLMPDDDLARLVCDKQIVRHGAKIRSVQENAQFVCDLTVQHGGAGKFFANWPSSDFIGLLEVLQKRGSRLGGATGQYLMRRMGVDGFIMSRDGVAALIEAGVVAKPPSSRKDFAAVQAAFNQWADETGLPLTRISRILGYSTGENRLPIDEE
jgi:3-methyladenine DNA glycosylase Tag